MFYKQEMRPVMVKVDDTTILKKNAINFIGIQFDLRLSCHQINPKIFQFQGPAVNLTSNLNSILYCDCKVWLLNILKQLLTDSSNALKVAVHYPKHNICYLNMHILRSKATPYMSSKYKLAFFLYKTCNEQISHDEWIH
jgi:hypothetical protein